MLIAGVLGAFESIDIGGKTSVELSNKILFCYNYVSI